MGGWLREGDEAEPTLPSIVPLHLTMGGETMAFGPPSDVASALAMEGGRFPIGSHDEIIMCARMHFNKT